MYVWHCICWVQRRSVDHNPGNSCSTIPESWIGTRASHLHCSLWQPGCRHRYVACTWSCRSPTPWLGLRWRHALSPWESWWCACGTQLLNCACAAAWTYIQARHQWRWTSTLMFVWKHKTMSPVSTIMSCKNWQKLASLRRKELTQHRLYTSSE